jgi:hypothetical protein
MDFKEKCGALHTCTRYSRLAMCPRTHASNHRRRRDAKSKRLRRRTRVEHWWATMHRHCWAWEWIGSTRVRARIAETCRTAQRRHRKTPTSTLTPTHLTMPIATRLVGIHWLEHALSFAACSQSYYYSLASRLQNTWGQRAMMHANRAMKRAATVSHRPATTRRLRVN